LAAAPDSLRHGELHHFQHTVMAHRVAALGRHLEGVLALTLQDNYAPALALARTCLEHAAIDALVLLADKYVHMETVTDEVWDAWLAARERGEDWTRDITSWERRKNNAVLVMQGLPVRSESGETQYLLSRYYNLLERYQPFAPRPSDTERLDDGLGDIDVRQRHAASNKAVYDLHLRWPSIKRSLEVNSLADAFALEQLDTHYRFLSAFTHPTTDTRELVYGRNQWTVPFYDHYTSELCLLYIAALAAWELRTLLAMSQRKPTVGIDGQHEIEALRFALERASSHLWFLGQGPSDYDRFQARNKAAWKGRSGDNGWRERLHVPDVPDAEVGYYLNPLERLIAMHRSTQEMTTGLAYDSPWRRQDADPR
jgi:hypothetical protein